MLAFAGMHRSVQRTAHEAADNVRSAGDRSDDHLRSDMSVDKVECRWLQGRSRRENQSQVAEVVLGL